MHIFKILNFKKSESQNALKIDTNDITKQKNETMAQHLRTQDVEGTSFQKINQNIKKRYSKAIATKDIASFHQEALSLVIDHLKEGEFGEYDDFMKEMEYFLHYLFLMLQDDFFLGEKLFEQKMTKLDDYIFSQYRKQPNLEENIQKMTILSYSNRFDKNPRVNLLSYFVFIEETGIELIALLQDFYNMLEKSQQHKGWFSFSKNYKITKTYFKIVNNMTEDLNSDDLESAKTFYTVQPSFFENSKDAQVKIYRDNLNPSNVKENLKNVLKEDAKL